MNIIITMAGLGSRFRQAGYTVPKYEVMVRGRTLFAWSLGSLENFIEGSRFVFVCLREAGAGPFIAAQARSLGIRDHALLELDGLTDGQATSALHAGPVLGSTGAPVLIYNIDTYVEPQFLIPEDMRCDGWIPCFPGKGDAWSFARLDENGRVAEVREKKRISPHATIGLYAFSSFDLYRAAYGEYFSDPGNVERGERYIAPLYNHLIRQGREVRISLIPERGVHPLGTPADVERFSQEGAT